MRHDHTHPAPSPVRPWTRLLALLGVLALCAVALVACSGSDDTADAGAETGEGAWTFTDDAGETITLDEAPDTIVAETTMAGGLWELGVTPAATYGPRTGSEGTKEPSIGLADPDDLGESLGEEFGQINLEQLAALEPDVIVAPYWGDGTYWGIDDTMKEQILEIAPLIGIDVTSEPTDQVLSRVADLAEALGADLEDGKAAAVIADFEAASTKLSEATAANPGVRVQAVSGSDSILYVAVPSGYSDLKYFQQLGVEMVEPDTDEEFWEELSWEAADKYPADMIIADARSGSVEEITAALPQNAQQLPAVQAGQLHLWMVPYSNGYGYFATILDDLATQISAARSGLS
jgi:iron complex transport system substrate-binding protein